MNTLFRRFLLFLQLLSEFKYIFCCTYPRISTWVCSDVPSDSCSQINPFLSSEFLLFFLFSNYLWLASEFELRCSFFSSTPNLWEYVLYSCHCSTVCDKAVCRCKFISSQQLAIRLKGLCHQIRITWKWYCCKRLGMDMRRLIYKNF
jgi:hypothetical protein